MNIWLDDERLAPEGWVWVKTADAAIRVLDHHATARESIEYMSFDHDLADVHYDYFHAGAALPKDHPARAHAREAAAREQTGYDVLLWMAEHNVWPTKGCFVHTHNSARGNAMAGVINRYGPYAQSVRWTPYGEILRGRLGRLTEQD